MILRNEGGSLQIIEKQHRDLTYGYLFGGAGLILLVIGILVQEPSLVGVGLLFAGAGLLVAWNAETITTTMLPDGAITIIYERLIGRKRWVRHLHKSELRSLDYTKGFDEQDTFFNDNRWCKIYLNTISDEQIKIGSRYHATWFTNKFGLPISKHSVPLDAEAAQIGNFLSVDVNTISYQNPVNAMQNFYNPHDRMAVMAQRPTQEQLDKERIMGSHNINKL